MRGRRDPSLVRFEEAVIVVTTDGCRKEMSLPRAPVDLAQPRPLCCFLCGRVRQLRFVPDPGSGMRAVWSDPPGAGRRWRWFR